MRPSWIRPMLFAGALLAASAAWAGDLSAGIVGPEKSMPGDLVVLKAVFPDGAGVAWTMHPASKEGELPKYLVVDDGETVVFASRVAGEYVFVLAIAQDNRALVYTHVLRNIEEDPDPDPDPIPPPGKRFVLAVVETKTRTADQAVALSGLRTYLEAEGHTYRFVDPDIKSTDGDPPDWFDDYAKHLRDEGVGYPALVVGVLSDDGEEVTTMYARELPATASGCIEFVKQHGG